MSNCQTTIRLSFGCDQFDEILATLPKACADFIDAAQSYNNTAVYLFDSQVWIDSLKGEQSFSKHLPSGSGLETVRTLSEAEQYYLLTGEGEAPKAVMIGNRKALGNVFKVTIAA